MNKKILSLALATTFLVSAVPLNSYAKSSDNYWEESTDTEINRAVNKVKVYKDAIVVYTNSSNTSVSFFDDDENRIIQGNTDALGNLIFNVNGYHDHMHKDHYLEVGNVKVFLDDDKVEIVNGYYYDENADDDYDSTDADENDQRVFPKYNFTNNGNTIDAELKDYANKVVKIYYDDKLVTQAKVDKNEKFVVNLPNPIRNKNMMKFYVSYDRPTSPELKVWELNTTEFSVSGKYNQGVNIVAYYGDKELGETIVGSDGIFTIQTNYRLPRNANVKFYEVNSPLNISSNNSYIKGYEDNTFRPENKVTRAEASMMFARLMNGSDKFESNSTKYSDANNAWYSGAVFYVDNKSVIKGYPNGVFKPNKNITRAEFVQMISNYLNENVDGKSSFRDTADHWAKDAIDIATDKGYIKGYPDGYFRPDAEITRAEAVKILNETFSISSSGSSNNNFKDLNKSAWYYKEILKATNM